MSDGRTHVERWRTHRPPAPTTPTRHPGADPALCAICNPKEAS